MTALLGRPTLRSSAAARRPPVGWPWNRVSLRQVDCGVLATLLVVALVVHGWGMFGYPSMTTTDDEGTYVAQAWSVVRWGELAHYTYWYDHPPVGWLQIAGWAWITDGFGRYDTAVGVGREAVLVARMVSVGALYVLARRLRLSPAFSALAVLLLACSPLAVHYGRMVFLDNIATAWLLVSFALVAGSRRRLGAQVMAACCFVVAVMTKETTALVLPALVYAYWQGSDRRTRRYTLSLAGVVLVLGVALYPVYALLKGELLSGPGHVSLQYGVVWQLFGRTASGSVLTPGSPANGVVSNWLSLDTALLVLGVAAVPVALLVRRLRPVAVVVVLLVALVLRPGYLPDPYVIVLLPFAALTAAGALHALWNGRTWLHQRPLRPDATRTAARVLSRSAVAAVVVALAVVVVPQWTPKLQAMATSNGSAPLPQSRQWLVDNVDVSETMLVSDSQWVDLVEAGFDPDRVIWYFKADTDPAVSATLPGGWRDVDYVVFTADMEKVASDPTATIGTARDARAHGRPVASFGAGNDRITVYRVDRTARD